MASINSNKESFELLRGSADSNSASDISEIVFPIKKKRYRRRLKNNPSAQHEEVTNSCKCTAKNLSSILFCLVLLCWLVTLTWLAFVLHNQLNHLTSHVSEVVAGIQGVPDALQKCHTLSKDLQKNQSQIMNRLTGFSILLTNFSLEIAEVKSGLQTVQDQLKSSPDLINNPRLVKDLSASVASFGSQIRDLNSTVFTLKDQNGKLDNLVGNLVSNVTEMKMKITELSNLKSGKNIVTEKNLATEKEAILAIVNQVSKNLSVVNDTLSNKLQWTAQDQSKDHNLLENLREMNENITARVKTLENLCAKDSNPKIFSGNFTSSHNSMSENEQPKPVPDNLKSPSAKDLPFSPSLVSGGESGQSKTQQNQP